jgi:hypothetical protein
MEALNNPKQQGINPQISDPAGQTIKTAAHLSQLRAVSPDLRRRMKPCMNKKE